MKQNMSSSSVSATEAQNHGTPVYKNAHLRYSNLVKYIGETSVTFDIIIKINLAHLFSSVHPILCIKWRITLPRHVFIELRTDIKGYQVDQFYIKLINFIRSNHKPSRRRTVSVASKRSYTASSNVDLLVFGNKQLASIWHVNECMLRSWRQILRMKANACRYFATAREVLTCVTDGQGFALLM